MAPTMALRSTTINPPSDSQPTEVEQKKKKQTLERAKANHLSRQLQMRLQYARLKVENGWQRQNLNEVENLYFHHSQRGPRGTMPDKHSWITTASIPPMSAAAAASAAVSSTHVEDNSGKQQDANIPGTHAFHVAIPIDPVLLSGTNATASGDASTLPPDFDMKLVSQAPGLDAAMAWQSSTSSAPAPEPSNSAPSPVAPLASSITSPSFYAVASSAPPSVGIAQPTSAPSMQSQSSHLQTPSAPQSGSPPKSDGLGSPVSIGTRSSRRSGTTNTNTNSLSQASMSMSTGSLNFSGGTSLTYDSFWSSHAATTPGMTFRNGSGRGSSS